jgi:cellulose biosynthesis protein BcsQ
MAKIINLFNQKGGVSKITTVFNLSWMLATMGKRVRALESRSEL